MGDEHFAENTPDIDPGDERVADTAQKVANLSHIPATIISITANRQRDRKLNRLDYCLSSPCPG
jgi:hypothetical protein